MTEDQARQLAAGDRVVYASDDQYVYHGSVGSIGGYDRTCVNIDWDDGIKSSVHVADMENFNGGEAS